MDHYVSVKIAEQKRRLKEDQAGSPHRSRPAKRRQDQLGEKWFEKEQQERPEKSGRRQQNRQQSVPAVGGTICGECGCSIGMAGEIGHEGSNRLRPGSGSNRAGRRSTSRRAASVDESFFPAPRE